MAYERKFWVNKNEDGSVPDGATPISADNLNRIEDCLQKTFDKVACTNMKDLVIQKISSSCKWIAPRAVKNMFRIFCVGGGGGGKNIEKLNYSTMILGGGGGGGGYIQICDVELEHGTEVDVVCGAGGSSGADGGKTSFGSYLSAAGGGAGKDGCPDNDATKAYSGAAGNGGDGGSGGGGGGANFETTYSGTFGTLTGGNGGNGGLYGGGGGAGGISQVKAP
jgi:hypothetical protein